MSDMESNCFKEIVLPEQKIYDGLVFPAVLSSPNSINFMEAIAVNKPWLESLLHKHGAILFRGFSVSSPSDFNDVVEAFGFDELPYDGGAAPRTNVVGRVFTANESPPHLKIPFHHEMSLQPEFPSKLFFYCCEPPVSGGETPIVLSHILYERVKEKKPEFVQQLEEHGLMYSRLLGAEDNLSSPAGQGWKSRFKANDKIAAQQSAEKLGLKLEWIGNSVKTTVGPLPAFKLDDERNRKIWFNNVFTVKDIKFGNGKPLPDNIVHDCSEIAEEECVAIPWEKGDVLLLDNLAVLHSRRPLITPPRIVLASLCKENKWVCLHGALLPSVSTNSSILHLHQLYYQQKEMTIKFGVFLCSMMIVYRVVIVHQCLYTIRYLVLVLQKCLQLFALYFQLFFESLG